MQQGSGEGSGEVSGEGCFGAEPGQICGHLTHGNL